jgi:aspartate/methionine/tyrosine aminotransferase
MTHNSLANRVTVLQGSATMALDARVKEMAASGQKVYNLTAGELDCPTPTYIQEAVAQTLHQNKYTALPGMVELRAAIASHTCSFYGVDWVTPAHVVVTAGAKPALATAFLALINPGDEVIVPIPAWVSYKHLIELAGGVVVEVPLSSTWDLDVPAIESCITSRTKMILVNSPHNPTGAIFSDKSLRELAALLKNTEILVLSDDIYTKLVYTNDYRPITSFDFEPDNLVIINGFSKSQALTGWRIGYVVSSTTIVKAITKLLSHITGNAAVPSQHAAIAALSRDDVPEMLPELHDRREMVAQKLGNIPQLSFEKPAGAFYFFLDLRAITANSAKWCEQLLIEKHVAIVPGEAFAAPGFARLSFAASEPTLQGGIKRIHEFVTGEAS